ncbi:MAG: hypothetical protein KBF32_09060 [Chitinophagales bacterium]|nr:hypothetical protein [Chitinophagales bacterium]
MNTALKVDDYWLIISDEHKIGVGEYYYYNNRVTQKITFNKTDEEQFSKVIAASKKIGELPLFDVPDDWENVDSDELKENLIILSKAWMTANDHKKTNMEAFIENVVIPQVNKAKEKYQFTEEDMEKAVAHFAEGSKSINK